MPKTNAKKANEKTQKRIAKRAGQEYAPYEPVHRHYNDRAIAASEADDPTRLISNLTSILLGAYPEVEELIKAEMEGRYPDAADAGRKQSAIINSKRRTAGTNYQGLVSYALATYLIEVESEWYVQHPVPKDLKEALSIEFEPVIADADEDDPLEEAAEETARALQGALEGEDLDDDDDEPDVFSVQPDFDIILRNAAHDAESDGPEPVLLLSAKTSLADRSGQAARWKLYFDLITHPCPLRAQDGCAYDSLGISLKNPGEYELRQGLVTANIYKIQFRDERYHSGELASGQTRSNTYMFDLKLTTRDDDTSHTPADWRQFPAVIDVLHEMSATYGLPFSRSEGADPSGSGTAAEPALPFPD